MKDLEQNDYIKIIASLLAIVLIILVLKVVKVNFIKPKHDSKNFSTEENIITNKSGDVSVAIAGNLLLSSKLQTTYNSSGLSGVISDDLQKKISSSDIAIMNQTFSSVDNTAGEYHVSSTALSILNDMGFNMVSLSNNYFRQFGAENAINSIYMLKNHNIKTAGAGTNQINAAAPAVYTYNNKSVGLMSVTITDTNDTSDGFAINSNGHVREQMGIYGESDIDRICDKIYDAKNNCDFLIVNVNWNTSGAAPSKESKSAAKSFIKSGADMITGCSNSFEGIEYYKGCPILYGTGNFLHSAPQSKTAVVKLNISRKNKVSIKLIPCISDAYYIREMTSTEKKAFYSDVTGLSKNIKITKKGEVLPS